MSPTLAPDLVGRVDGAAGVGEHDCVAAGRDRRPHRMDDRRDAEPFVEMDATEKDQRPVLADHDAPDGAAVAGGRGRDESGESGERHLGHRLPELVGRVRPAGAEHESDVVALDPGRRCKGAGGFVLGHAT
jgi:hypothetical protein